MHPNDTLTTAIAAQAASLVLEQGLEYGAAKAKAASALARQGGSGRAALPSNEEVEDAVREQLALFFADTQPGELDALRRLALRWMDRLSVFRPHLGGAVWRGTATRHSAIHIDLYCDDGKSAEIALLDLGIAFDSQQVDRGHGPAQDVLTVYTACRELGTSVPVHLIVQDHDALRGALKPDARGRTWRGDGVALRRLIDTTSASRAAT